MPANPLDTQFMARALHLAQKGRLTTSPNPNVGCVIVSAQGNVLGEGWHHKAGSPHAEVNALVNAGRSVRGSTVYVTLEPCSHTGRTGPCAQALIDAGVKRVVTAMVDPNPQVSGRGLRMLEQAGIEVESGVLSRQATQLNRGFVKRMITGRPYVTLKLAASLDGKSALNNGLSKWITGASARRDVQHHRARSCAILTGSGTVLADNPRLNVRSEELKSDSQGTSLTNLRQPARVVIDGKNQLQGEFKIWQQDAASFCINKQFNPALPQHVRQWQAPGDCDQINLSAVLQFLGECQFNDVWVEAGAGLAGALLAQNLIDELILYQAPKLIGEGGRGLFDLPVMQHMDEVIPLRICDVRMLADDLKITAQFNHQSE